MTKARLTTEEVEMLRDGLYKLLNSNKVGILDTKSPADHQLRVRRRGLIIDLIDRLRISPEVTL